MTKFALAAIAAASLMFSGAAQAQQPAAAPPPPLIDWDKIEIKTTDLGNKTYMLEGQGGNITVAVGSDGIIMVDGQFAPLSRQDQGGDQGDLAAAGQIPDQHAFPRRPHRRQRELRQATASSSWRTTTSAIRLAAGTINGLTGAKTPPVAPADALPKETYFGGSKHGGSRRPQGAAHPCQQRPHRRRHLGLFRRRQRAVPPATPSTTSSATRTSTSPTAATCAA